MPSRNDRLLGLFSAASSLAVVLALAGSARAQAPAVTSAPGSSPAPSAAGAPPPPAPTPRYPSPAQGWGAAPQGWAPPPAVAPAPPSAVAPNGEYVSPLSQTTQPVYVPQSVALSGPRFIKDWHDGDPIPWGYHREERARKGEIIAGSILFGVPYLYSSLIASIGNDAGTSKVDALWIPVLGPIIELKESNSTTLDYILVLDGLAQGIGAALAIHGATTPRPILVRNDLAMVTVTATPMGKDGAGVMMLGRF